VGEHLPGVDKEGGAGRGECDVVGVAVEQADAQFAFEAPDLLAQR
jgi:hypothetical protein